MNDQTLVYFKLLGSLVALVNVLERLTPDLTTTLPASKYSEGRVSIVRGEPLAWHGVCCFS